MKTIARQCWLFLGFAFLAGCGSDEPPSATAAQNAATADSAQESARLNEWLDARYEEELGFSPIERTLQGRKDDYDKLDDVSEDMSFLEMLDVLNEDLITRGEEPVAFDSDCREGICGMCGLMINGEAHGPEVTTTCQLHMRSFEDGDEIVIEPWRADPFPVIKDLVVDRRAFDRIIASGGYISVNTGAAPDAHAIPVPKD